MANDFSAEVLLRGIGLDRYEIGARLRPALLALAPVFLVVAVWVPQARSMVGVVVGLATTLGLTYFLAQLARRLGRGLERRLGDRVGRLHSARLLTFADETLALESKLRHHAFLRSNGIVTSTPEEERAAPDAAFARARSAVDWLLVYTRPLAKKSLLFDDNVAYGFMRNLRALKPLALAIVSLAMIVDACLAVFHRQEPAFVVMGSAAGAALIVFLLAWLFIVTEAAVEEASLAYAQRLFSQCETVETRSP